jgi:hypothetical protein
MLNMPLALLDRLSEQDFCIFVRKRRVVSQLGSLFVFSLMHRRGFFVLYHFPGLGVACILPSFSPFFSLLYYQKRRHVCFS